MSGFKELLKTWKTIPNLLSFIRILIIPFFGVAYFHKQYLLSVVILVFSGLTDLLDGKIARKFNQVSELGKLLDPIADKLTQMTIAVLLFITFIQSNDKTIKAFSWVFLFFIAKELLMVVVGVLMVALGLLPKPAVIWGKLATTFFYIIMCLILGFGPDIGALGKYYTMPNYLMIILVVFSAVSTFVALLSYVPDSLRQFKERKIKKSKEKLQNKEK